MSTVSVLVLTVEGVAGLRRRPGLPTQRGETGVRTDASVGPGRVVGSRPGATTPGPSTPPTRKRPGVRNPPPTRPSPLPPPQLLEGRRSPQAGQRKSLTLFDLRLLHRAPVPCPFGSLFDHLGVLYDAEDPVTRVGVGAGGRPFPTHNPPLPDPGRLTLKRGDD